MIGLSLGTFLIRAVLLLDGSFGIEDEGFLLKLM